MLRQVACQFSTCSPDLEQFTRIYTIVVDVHLRYSRVAVIETAKVRLATIILGPGPPETPDREF